MTPTDQRWTEAQLVHVRTLLQWHKHSPRIGDFPWVIHHYYPTLSWEDVYALIRAARKHTPSPS